jgi:hypothetical protein
VNYTAFLAALPEGFDRIKDIQVATKEIRILGRGRKTVTLSAAGIGQSAR